MALSVAPTQPADERAAGDNTLLVALGRAGLKDLGEKLEIADYPAGSILYEPYKAAKYVYFPFSCVVSIVNTVASGSTVEVGTVGNEGMAGLAVYLDSGETPNRTLVQVAGRMARFPAELLVRFVEQSAEGRRILNRYTLAFMAQISQTAACNRAHNIDQRCARWLLMTHDRVEGESFTLTHEFLAFMLGVRRAGVTVAAGILQKAGLITYKRGRITVLDRAGLEKAACDCYKIVNDEFAKFLDVARKA